MEFSAEIIERFRKTEPATYGHFMGVNCMLPRVRPMDLKMRLAGPAYTVKLLGKDSTALYKALNVAPEGSVIVIDRADDQTYAAVGEMVVRNAAARKMAGFVVDGMVTDSLAIVEMGFPVFATGISVMTTNVWGVSGEYDIPIQCGGIPVNPGDLILGNADGVISINNPNYMELLEQAEAAEAREVVMRERFAKGEFLLTDVDPLLAADVPGYIKQYREKGRR